jgi:hypothetical protein
MQNEYKGFSLFNDIDDVALRNRNRAVILSNLLESNIDKVSKKVSIKGANLILSYFSHIPPVDRKDVEKRFTDESVKRGFTTASV